MRFCPWYPLTGDADLVPPGENVLQLRVAVGLVDYPRGKTAMVHYTHTEDAPTCARALAARFPGDALWCRHLIEHDDAIDLRAFHGKLVAEFVQRFGEQPRPAPP